MRQEKLEIDQQLRAIQGSSMGSMQNFPVSRRSERPYSNDNDSVNRSNRGGSRGRGRGRGGNRRFHPGNNIQHDHMDNNEQPTNISATYTNINEQKKMNSRGGGGGRGRGGNSNDTRGGSRGGGVGDGRDRNGNGRGGDRSDLERHNDRRPPRPSSASTSSTPK